MDDHTSTLLGQARHERAAARLEEARKLDADGFDSYPARLALG